MNKEVFNHKKDYLPDPDPHTFNVEPNPSSYADPYIYRIRLYGTGTVPVLGSRSHSFFLVKLFKAGATFLKLIWDVPDIGTGYAKSDIRPDINKYNL